MTQQDGEPLVQRYVPTLKHDITIQTLFLSPKLSIKHSASASQTYRLSEILSFSLSSEHPSSPSNSALPLTVL
jgi:hypothetical protein